MIVMKKMFCVVLNKIEYNIFVEFVSDYYSCKECVRENF